MQAETLSGVTLARLCCCCVALWLAARAQNPYREVVIGILPTILAVSSVLTLLQMSLTLEDRS